MQTFIFHIVQHYGTKLCSLTNSEILFLIVVDPLSLSLDQNLVYSWNGLYGGRVGYSSIHVYIYIIKTKGIFHQQMNLAILNMNIRVYPQWRAGRGGHGAMAPPARIFMGRNCWERGAQSGCPLYRTNIIHKSQKLYKNILQSKTSENDRIFHLRDH